MKQKLWIFGDSYADPILNHEPLNPWESDVKYWDGWSHWLEKDYEVENFAQAGVGADTCFLELCKKVDREPRRLDHISVVFACPNFYSRVVLTGYEKEKSWAFPYYAYDRKEFDKIISNNNLNKNKAPKFGTLHDRYHEFVKIFITDYMGTQEYDNKVNMIMGALDCYAKYFKKFILIPVVDISGWLKPKRENHFQNMTVRDDICLQKLSAQGKFPDDETFKLLVGRGSNVNAKETKYLYPNHLDVDSNKIVYDIVKEWMDQVG